MFKATRELIKARQPHTKFVVEQVFVKQTGSGTANQCFQNATDDQMLATGNKVVSGWVVSAYDSQKNSTAIVQHWWNADANGSYFDTTPNIGINTEYVIDSEIADFGQENFDQLKDLVALSLLFQNGEFFGVEKIEGKLTIQPLQSLSTKKLFKLS